ncbi:hypothetical protein [Streptomyces sp. SPB78]|nr:hypothetical protein [Streptomyces sp. SPB78]
MRGERTSGGYIKGQDREDMLQARDEVGQCEAVNGGAPVSRCCGRNRR